MKTWTIYHTGSDQPITTKATGWKVADGVLIFYIDNSNYYTKAFQDVRYFSLANVILWEAAP